MVKLVLMLGDQLSLSIAALKRADKAADLVVMAEVQDEATYIRHHPKKIALVLSSMRKFAGVLRGEGWNVAYTRLDDPENTGSIAGELLRRAEQVGASRIAATCPGEWRLVNILKGLPLEVELLEDDRFICSRTEFEDWARGRKQLRMEHFYRDMRRKTGLLMDGGGPAGGKWNFDHDNRKPAPRDLPKASPRWFVPDETVDEVLDLVDARFSDHFGDLRPFRYGTDHRQADAVLDHFIQNALPHFGDFQDAMLSGDPFLYHALISAYLNIGLLDPLDACRRAEGAWREGRAPINAVEGFVRQIIGWREFVRGIYFLAGPEYTQRNALGHRRRLPDMYWGAETDMACMSSVVSKTRAHAYSHHIERLMVAGNFALLLGVDPAEVHDWYHSVYIDAFEWVEAPNTLGMSQFADGGMVASKPYVSSGNYVSKMSDYCDGCAYSVKAKTGADACPFNLLYWHFLHRHRERFQRNPRLAQIYRTWDKMGSKKKEKIILDAELLLKNFDNNDD